MYTWGGGDHYRLADAFSDKDVFTPELHKDEKSHGNNFSISPLMNIDIDPFDLFYYLQVSIPLSTFHSNVFIL